MLTEESHRFEGRALARLHGAFHAAGKHGRMGPGEE
jgi:hypothetical protein